MQTVSQSEKAVPVRAHRFGAGPEYTLGIEEELMLLDEHGLALTAGVEQLVAAVADERVKPELMQCQVELATSPQATVTAAEDELRDLRERVVRVGAQLGLRVAGAGTHDVHGQLAFTVFRQQRIDAPLEQDLARPRPSHHRD